MAQIGKIIHKTENYLVEVPERPFVSRTDGGHIRINMKNPVSDRTRLSPKQAIELMRLTIIVGQALKIAMNNRGIPVIKINYQDMGNWAWKKSPIQPKLHVHIFGRAKNATKQIFPEAVQLPDCSTGFYDGFEPLNDEDIKELKKQIALEVKKDKYETTKWSLS